MKFLLVISKAVCLLLLFISKGRNISIKFWRTLFIFFKPSYCLLQYLLFLLQPLHVSFLAIRVALQQFYNSIEINKLVFIILQLYLNLLNLIIIFLLLNASEGYALELHFKKGHISIVILYIV